jgi:hypothetical protein
VGVVSVSTLLVALVVNALFSRFPTVLTTGDARLQVWIGPDGARWAFVALTVAIGTGAVVVAVRGTREPAIRLTWLRGAAWDGALGLLVAALSIGQAATATTDSGLRAAPMLLTLLLLAVPLGAGCGAAWASGRTGAGALTGFWFNLPVALLSSAGIIAADTLFADRLLGTAWADYTSDDRLCNGVHGATLLGCAVGDDLGFAATMLVLGPVLGVALGVLGGLVGRAFARGQGRAVAPLDEALKPALIFAGCLAAVMAAELLGNLW